MTYRRTLWSRLSLRAQLSWLLLAVAILIVGLSAILENVELKQRTIDQGRSSAKAFAVTVAKLLEDAPAHQRHILAEQLNTASRTVIIQPNRGGWSIEVPISAEELAAELSAEGLTIGEVHFSERYNASEIQASADDGKFAPAFRAAMRLPDETTWIVSSIMLPPAPTTVPLAFTIGADTMVTLLSLLAALYFVRRMTAPLEKLASSAERISHGDVVDPLALEGSADMSTTIEAFNHMSESVAQTIAYQKSLLQSLGHDLKTPLRNARAAVSSTTDGADRDKILSRLSELEGLLASITALTRATLQDGDVEKVDIGTMVEAVVGDAQERGMPIEADVDLGVIIPARFHALERALRNLTENAVTHGGPTKVSMETSEHNVTIYIDDEGDGVDEAELSSLFAPFVHLSNDPNSTGLGLAIARTIIMDLGGTITLENRPEGGLRQTVRLLRA